MKKKDLINVRNLLPEGESGSLRSGRGVRGGYIKISRDEPMENILHKIYICFEGLEQKHFF